MNLILRILLSALAVVVLAKILPGVGVDSYTTAIIVAIVLSLLNFIVKPILVILTLPVTILTLGLFLLIINHFVIGNDLVVGYSFFRLEVYRKTRSKAQFELKGKFLGIPIKVVLLFR